MTFAAEFQLLFRDIREASRISGDQLLPESTRIARDWAWLLLSMAFLMFLVQFLDPEWRNHPIRFTSLLIFILITGVQTLGFNVVQYTLEKSVAWVGRLIFFLVKRYFKPVILYVDENGIRMMSRMDRRSFRTRSVRWDSISSIIETQNLVLFLYTPPKDTINFRSKYSPHLIVPKRAFQPDDLAKFIEFCKSHLVSEPAEVTRP
jgi:hypothetical protein